MVTMKQFLVNPTGSGSASVARRDRIRLDMNNRFNALYKKHKGKFKCNFYYDPKQNDIYYVLNVPSEVYAADGLYYDVVIKLKGDPNKKIHRLLENREMQVFSNSPNFTYTYAYVFNSLGMLVDWCKPKAAPKSLTESPTVRNPDNVLGFEKSVYFSILYITTILKKGLDEGYITSKASKLNTKAVTKNIKTALQKNTEYQGIDKKHREEAKKTKERKAKIKNAVQTVKNTVTLGLMKDRSTKKTKSSNIRKTPKGPKSKITKKSKIKKTK